MAMNTVLLIIALICFALSSFGVGAPLNLQSIGLACLTASMLVGTVFK